VEGVCVIDINPATVIFRRKGISPIAASRVFLITPWIWVAWRSSLDSHSTGCLELFSKVFLLGLLGIEK
jgi:hypothetical protein